MASLNDGERALLDGETARREKRHVEALRAFGRAADYFRAARDKERLAHALSREAQIARDLKNYDDGYRVQNEAVDLSRETGSASLPHRIRHLADILREKGDAHAAAPLYEEVLALYRMSTEVSPLELANTTRSIASNSQALGD